MRTPVWITTSLALSLAVLGAEASAQSRPRSDVAPHLTWDLTDVYPSEAEWEQDKAAIVGRIGGFAKHKATLAQSSEHLLAALEERFALHRALSRLSVYASMLSDLDTRAPGPLAMKQEIQQIWTRFETATSFVDPEILAMSEPTLKAFFAEEPRLGVYRRYVDRILRMKPHTLDARGEALIAAAGMMAGVSEATHNVFLNADLEWKKATLSDGSVIDVDQASYLGHRTSLERDDRKAVFGGFYETLGAYQRTIGTMVYGKVKENLFHKQVRGYRSVLDMALYGDAIPAEVYTKLIDDTHRYLPLLHRYLKIRKRMLGVDELHYYDFYPELVPDADLAYPYQKAFAVVKDALGVLGSEYVGVLDQAFENRWIDVYPTVGKTGGNYMENHFDTHPYVFLNFGGRFPDMNMLAHELGHAVHSHLSDSHQAYPTSHYSSFVAETAASTNEALLVEQLLQEVTDPKQRLALLGSTAEKFRQTIFRQVLFAEFELEFNRMAEQGESLTGEVLTRLYLKLLRKYYGHAEGVSVIDEIYGHEWGYISHFFLGFYNYQYASCYAAALAVAEKMARDDPGMVDKYLQFLSSGGSKDSITLLQELGVDMTTSEPFDLAMVKLERALDEMERLLQE